MASLRRVGCVRAGTPPIGGSFQHFRAMNGSVGPMVVYKSPQLDFLEGRDDIAALWDIRVAPEWRGQGVGSLLFEHVVRYARKIGCVELKIETQDVNVGAGRFYAKQGCGLAGGYCLTLTPVGPTRSK